MIIKPKVRGFICITAHPEGCAAHVQEQIDFVRSQAPLRNGPRKVLVIGASTGYGLAARIAAAFGGKAATVGVFFERPSTNGRCASAGWYNSAAFEKKARREGLYVKSINGDAFSNPVKERVIRVLKNELGPLDLVIYSLAAPRRVHSETGLLHKSVLKPIGESFSGPTVDTDRGIIKDIHLPPASKREIGDTVAVMGGEDWEMWMNQLGEAGLLGEGCRSVAFSYIGPKQTWPIYKRGTIGRAKHDLAKAAQRIDASLKTTGGGAFISVNKAVVTQASAAIPIVPLYISILFKIMKKKGLHEGCIEQLYRLYATQMYNDSVASLDETGQVRLDDWEMKPEVQNAVAMLWKQVTNENFQDITDYAGYKAEFLKLFGFGIPGVDYGAPCDPEVDI
ncbi:MAG: enoyl-[acyl-carrier-protein] reductase FabV [Opitutae bacterium]|nr:enoyl-[acyl-carrier-protein] reductase FabV [Opitutae bacterium]